MFSNKRLIDSSHTSESEYGLEQAVVFKIPNGIDSLRIAFSQGKHHVFANQKVTEGFFDLHFYYFPSNGDYEYVNPVKEKMRIELQNNKRIRFRGSKVSLQKVND